MQLNHFNQYNSLNEYPIYTIEDIHQSLDHFASKDRKNKIYEELENVVSKENVHFQKDLVKYMKRKMLCFYNPKIVAEMLNLMKLDHHSDAISRSYFKNNSHFVNEI